jgi:hypothetical protein
MGICNSTKSNNSSNKKSTNISIPTALSKLRRTSTLNKGETYFGKKGENTE